MSFLWSGRGSSSGIFTSLDESNAGLRKWFFMATLATDLLRTVVRAFYPPEHVLVIDALVIHSTLPRHDLGHLLGMQDKALGKVCGRLREDGLLAVQTRAERRADCNGGFSTPSSAIVGKDGGAGTGMKERYTNREWYYLHFHRAIDSIKYRMYKLHKYVEALGAPTTETKDHACPRCHAQWTDLEVMDRFDPATGAFLCRRCGHALDAVEDDARASENESMKRLNGQLAGILQLMQQIDASSVPENDFQSALRNQKPIVRGEAHPGQKMEVLDLPKHNLQSSKGLEMQPEKISVTLQDEEDVRRANREAEEQERRAREARQNLLPEWIAKSTVSGDVTTVGAKEEQLRREREVAVTSSLEVTKGKEVEEERKPVVGSAGGSGGGDEDVMAAYWAEMERANAQQAAEDEAEEEEEEEEYDDDDDVEDEFEDVMVTGAKPPPSPSHVAAIRGTATANGGATSVASTGANTPAAMESSNATDDEQQQDREVKRVKLDLSLAAPSSLQPPPANGEALTNGVPGQDTPAASDADEDEDEDGLEFENV